MAKATTPQVKELVDEKVQEKKVMMFSKSGCPYCAKAKKVFQKYLNDGTLSVDEYQVMEIDRNSRCGAIQDYLLSKTGARSVPRVFVSGTCIGGGDDVVALDSQQKLGPLLKEKNFKKA